MRSADEEHNMEEYMADNMKGIVKAVCTSPAKGTEKKPVAEAFFIVGHGIEGDAHAGKWHRQVSLLSYDKVEAFNALGAQVEDESACRIDFPMRHSCPEDDADRKRMSYQLRDPKQSRRLHHAQRRRLRGGAGGGRDQTRR